MFISVNKKWQLVLDISMIILGTFIMGISFSIFLEPNNISTGGFSGLSMIINSLLHSAGITFLTSSIIYLVLNVGLFAIAYRVLGKSFALKAIIGIVSFSLAMEIFALIPSFQNYENVISGLFGGVIMGFGMGIVVRFGGSTGGSDMVASIFKNKFKTLSIGKIVICVDICVVTLSIFVYPNGLELLPYTILSLFVASKVADITIEGYKQIKAFNIITTNPEELSQEIMIRLQRGCTVHDAKGMHGKQNRAILICLVSKFQIAELRRIINEVSPDSFVYSISVGEVIGEWNRSQELKNIKKKDKTKKCKEDNTDKHL